MDTASEGATSEGTTLHSTTLDAERCYRAVSSRDARFDGWFYVGVVTTGIYCRPSCPAMTPKRHNVRFFRAAGAAQAAGLRACRRCRPDAVPGSPEWNMRADLAGRAMRLIADGAVERDGVPGLARRLGYSERQLNRQLVAEVGAGPLALARAQRASTARVLIETSRLPMADVAFAAGFSSVRQFNDTVREVFVRTPTQLRAEARTTEPAPGLLSLRLAVRPPFDAVGLWAFLAGHLVPGVEEVVGDTYRRSLRLPHGTAVVELAARPDHVACRLRLTDLRDLTAAVQRCRRLLDLDADPDAIDHHLGHDPHLGPLVRRFPGRRMPGSVDPAETAVRAVIGQQVSVAGARTLAARMVVVTGDELPTPDGGLTHLWPTPQSLAAAPDAALSMPATRRRTIRGLGAALADGTVDLDPGVDRDDAELRLRALPGIGPWTASYVRMRGLGDPDVLIAKDLAIDRLLRTLGVPDADRSTWAPWRSYAVMHLWGAVGAFTPKET
ncbi:MAG: DNA-3-methyladenine glycosylase 2 family protein [Geodermatophilaceae bacterium]|nr:DNA-3-methyladenine glycosylase 2 family protein [Geodermatophilaceae bacterium]